MSQRQKYYERQDLESENQAHGHGTETPSASEGHLKSRVVKRSLVVGGHKTSVSLEDAFWLELRAIAQSLGVHLSQLVGSIDLERQHSNLSSAIRLFVFEYRSRNGADELSQTAQAVLVRAKRYSHSAHHH
jgi:predicted DNA-binding ribbon-helix-helix protein